MAERTPITVWHTGNDYCCDCGTQWSESDPHEAKSNPNVTLVQHRDREGEVIYSEQRGIWIPDPPGILLDTTPPDPRDLSPLNKMLMEFYAPAFQSMNTLREKGL